MITKAFILTKENSLIGAKILRDHGVGGWCAAGRRVTGPGRAVVAWRWACRGGGVAVGLSRWWRGGGPVAVVGLGGDGDAGLGGVDGGGEGLDEVELDPLGVVGQVADRQVLAEAQLVVAAAAGQQQRAVDRGRPDDVAVEQPGQGLADRVGVVGGIAD